MTILILIRLIIAHLLADFVLQPRSWIETKKSRGLRSPGLWYHSAVVGLLTWLLLWDWSQLLLPLVVAITHLLIDWWKSRQPDHIAVFILDQAAHLAVILGCWVVYTGGADYVYMWIGELIHSADTWILLLGYIAVLWPAGYVIAIVTERWRVELGTGAASGPGGLEDAGMWIGWTERFIILTLILLSQYGAIGFLIAAKSVFRFSGKLADGRERKEAEYILIGTLLSFAIAITIGMGTAWLLNALT